MGYKIHYPYLQENGKAQQGKVTLPSLYSWVGGKLDLNQRHVAAELMILALRLCSISKVRSIEF